MKVLRSFECLTFGIPGEPMPMPRARHSNAGGFVRTYTPATAVAHKAAVQWAWLKAVGTGGMIGQSKVPLDAIVSICVTVVKQLPKSAPKWLRAIVNDGEGYYNRLAELPPAVPSRGDWDNFGKLVCDALQGLAYRNDSQVYDGRCTKVWGWTARTVVEVTWWRWES